MKKNENRPQDTGRENPQDRRDNPQGSRRDQDMGRNPQDTRQQGSKQGTQGTGKNPQGSERLQGSQQQGKEGSTRTNPQGSGRSQQSGSTQGARNTGGTQGQRGQGSRSVEERLQGNWDSYKGRLREDYGDLTDEDLQYERGKESDLLGRIERRTGMNRDQFNDWMDSQEDDEQ
jgi:uncharacterized protein YjbJ (UPF0337 family)